MARTKVQIEINELQDAINQLEAAKLFGSPHKLYEAVAQTPWAQKLGATPVMVYLRVKEVNVDPGNPVITMKVKPARKVEPRKPSEPGEQGEGRPVKTRRAKVTGMSFPGIDILIDMFQGRGIDITDAGTGVGWLVTSSQKSDAENRAIMLAWADLRDKLGIPKPAKKSVASTGEELVRVPVLPIAAESITVTEEMPDGHPVGEPEIILDVTSVEPAVPSVLPSPPTPVAPAAVPVAVRAVPSPIQVTAVRPVTPRPMPVRSSVPPRPMPITTG